jgi:hypothetical protein
MEVGSKTYWTDASAVVADAEFQELIPPLSASEQELLIAVLHREGCREPLIVWPCRGRKILVAGYHYYSLLRRFALPFQALDREFPTRAAARMYVIQNLLAGLNLSPLAVSYLRGLRYQGEKQPEGGDRRGDVPRGKTAEALAEIFHVSPRTIRYDALVTEAVDHIASQCGKEARQLLLARDARLRRGTLLALAGLSVDRQRAVMSRWYVEGKLSRPKIGDGDKSTLTLPRPPAQFAAALRRRVGPERVKDYLTALEEVCTTEAMAATSFANEE